MIIISRKTLNQRLDETYQRALSKGYAMGVKYARSEGYKDGLVQGRFDAYVNNLPPCPDCKQTIRVKLGGQHLNDCPMRHRTESW